MSTTAYVVNPVDGGGGGTLGDRDDPFTSVDDAVLAWYDILPGGGPPSNGSNEELTVIILEEGVYPLQLEIYANIIFSKPVGNPDAILLSQISNQTDASTFRNVSFDNVNHTILSCINLSADSSTTNPIIYNNTILYNERSLVNLALNPNGCPPIPDNDGDTADLGDDFIQEDEVDDFPEFDDQILAISKTQTRRNNRVTWGDKRNKVQSKRTPKSKSKKLKPNSQLKNTVRKSVLSQKLRLRNNHVGNLRQVVNPIIIFTRVNNNASVTIDGLFTLNAQGHDVIGIQNNGVVVLNLDVAIFRSGSVVAGPGTTLIFNSDTNLQSSFIVQIPDKSALISGTGPKRLLSVRLNVGFDTPGNSSVDNDVLIVSTDDERRVTDLKACDERRMFLFRNLPFDVEPPRECTDEKNDVCPLGPYNEISRSTINACAIPIPVYLSDTYNIRVSYNDLICIAILGAANGNNKNGPIFSLYSSSSLVTNGSTFFLPITIRDNYIHRRLDGTIFYVDISPLCPDKKEFVPWDGSEKCSLRKRRTVKIDLPGRCDWNGRLITYIRTDCEDADVFIRSDGCIQGHQRGHLMLCSRNTLTLHNKEGNYWVVSQFTN